MLMQQRQRGCTEGTWFNWARANAEWAPETPRSGHRRWWVRGEACEGHTRPRGRGEVHLLAELRLAGAALSAQLLTYYPTQPGAWAANVAFLSSFLSPPPFILLWTNGIVSTSLLQFPTKSWPLTLRTRTFKTLLALLQCLVHYC